MIEIPDWGIIKNNSKSKQTVVDICHHIL